MPLPEALQGFTDNSADNFSGPTSRLLQEINDAITKIGYRDMEIPIDHFESLSIGMAAVVKYHAGCLDTFTITRFFAHQVRNTLQLLSFKRRILQLNSKRYPELASIVDRMAVIDRECSMVMTEIEKLVLKPKISLPSAS